MAQGPSDTILVAIRIMRFGSGSPKSEIRILRIAVFGGGLFSLSASSSLYCFSLLVFPLLKLLFKNFLQGRMPPRLPLWCSRLWGCTFVIPTPEFQPANPWSVPDHGYHYQNIHWDVRVHQARFTIVIDNKK